MKIEIAGVDYQKTPIEIREKFSFTASAVSDFLEKIKEESDECILISTCNRTELCVISDTQPSEFLRRTRGDAHFFSLSGNDAVSHIYELAAGLCSQVPFEDQRLGQMKTALALSREAKCCGPVLSQLFQSAITAGKEIRTEVKKSPDKHAASAAHIACAKAKAELGSLQGEKTLIIGSGEIGMLCAQLFSDEGSDVTMTIRRKREDGLLPPPCVSVISYDSRYDAAKDCSVIIGATSSPHFVLTEEHFARPSKKTVILDLAVPRDIDPNIKNFDGVSLFDMDRLGQSAISSELFKITEEILKRHRSRFNEWQNVRECMPMIEDVCSFAEREMLSELSPSDMSERIKIKEAARNMVGKLLFTMKEKVDSDMAKNCYTALAKAARG